MQDITSLQFIQLIKLKLGLQIRPLDQESLKRKIELRMKAKGYTSPIQYYQLLASDRHIPEVDAEWRSLSCLLTTTETYFFRDQHQFSLLKHRLLPDLIAQKRRLAAQEGATLFSGREAKKLSLRVWSAGCSTGEEAYSISILLRELLPDYDLWNISIIGTDINQAVLNRAQQGIFGEWSFRAIAPEVRQRYFRPHQGEWEIDPQLRSKVTFLYGNLAETRYAPVPVPPHTIDLILCRNVFIYFHAAAIEAALTQFDQALSPWGYLLTAHTELQGQKNHLFQVISFPESIVYQRRSEPPVDLSPVSALPSPLLPVVAQGVALPETTAPSSPPSLAPQVALAAASEEASCPLPLPLQHLRALTLKKAYAEAISQAKQWLAYPLEANDRFQIYCLQAEAYANLGQHSQAIEACQQATQIDSLAIEPYYLLAHIAEEQGNSEQAKAFLKRIIYLMPTAVQAYVELGALYAQEENVKKAQKVWRSALEILQHLTQERSGECSQPHPLTELKTDVETSLYQLEVRQACSP